MTKTKYGFVFSTELPPSSSDRLKAKAERAKKYYEAKKKAFTDNPGKRHVQMMNDNLRA